MTELSAFVLTFPLIMGALLIALGFVEYYLKELQDLLGIREGRRYCPWCGKRINHDAKHCEECGRRLT